MAQRGTNKVRPLPGDRSDPGGLVAWMYAYLEAIAVRGYTPATLLNRQEMLRRFAIWCEQRGLTRPQAITRPILQAYQRGLFYYRKPDGRPLAATTQTNYLVALKMFFRWLTRENVVLANPASELDMPKVVRRLPRFVLTAREAEQILAIPDLATPLGLRDRAILELFYSTGLRRMEVLALKALDLDQGRGTLMVWQGKGRKDRLIPVGERALGWCDRYLQEVRPELTFGPDDGTLFLTYQGEAITPCRLSQIVRRYVREANLGKDGACHLFRHTVATLMLENGADIRHVQEMLGHADLKTTQIYTKVSIRHLKEVHTRTHPAEKLGRPDPELEETHDGPEEP